MHMTYYLRLSTIIMGRYYTGDIEGKFGTSVQPSNDFETFGAYQLETSTVPYTLDNERIPRAIEITRGFIDEFREKCPEVSNDLNLNTSPERFWKMVDDDWYQDDKNGLLACRICMGLKIVQFHRKYPQSDICIDAEF